MEEMPGIDTPDLSIDGLHPLAPVCEQWLKKIELAAKYKFDRFTKYADAASKYYDGGNNWMWSEEQVRSSTSGFLDENSNTSLPMFRMTVNRAFEAVALFGPALYHQNPNIMVTSHPAPEITPEALGVDPSDEQAVQFFQQMLGAEQSRQNIRKCHASLMQTYLNWLQLETDKKTQSRRAINEAIIKGMSTLWPEVYTPPGSEIKFPRSLYVSIDDIQLDPDAKYWEDIQWVARRCVHPVNKVEDEYGLPRGSLKGHLQSSEAQGDTFGSVTERPERERRERDGLGRTHDMIEYWKIYSKNGFGNHLSRTSDTSDVYSKYDFTQFGPFNYIVVAKGVPFPLNCPSNKLAEEEFEQIFERVQWPIPFWSDPNCDGGWPFTRIYFYETPETYWPMSLFKPAMGELRFINWCMSFLADKVAQSATTYLGVLKAAGGEIKKQLNGPAQPYRVLEISEVTGKKLSECIDFIQAPNFQIDIWNMVSQVNDMIDKRTGLTELIYGLSSRQIRSAREADIREGNISIRPDDMASRTEDFLSNTAAKEMQIARWVCDGVDVQGSLGPIGSNIWDEQILTENYDALVRDYSFRVEAGSARKPNKNTRVDTLTQFGQTVMGMLEAMAMQGNVQPWNAYAADMAKALDLDPEPYLLQPPEPQEGPTPEQQQMELEQAKAQMKMQIDQMKLQIDQQKMQLDQQAAMAKLAIQEEAAQAKVQAQRQSDMSKLESQRQADMSKLELEREKFLLQAQAEEERMEMDEESHDQELRQDEEVHKQELEQMKEKGALEKLLMRAKAQAAAKQRPSTNGSSTNGAK